MEDDAHKCIGACYPPDVIYYNPITLHIIKNKHPSCPIYPSNGRASTYCSNPDANATLTELFDSLVSMASSPHLFLSQFYDLNNIHDVNIFLKNEITILPKNTQKRILKAIFETCRDETEFPTKEYIEKLYDTYDGKLTITKLAKRVLKVKNDLNVVDIYENI